jgi:ferredoxin/flavodoxin---NADP+ reductase
MAQHVVVPLRVAVVGSGPAGFYAIESLFKQHPEARADLFERLPVPYGLVRGGVAPDHPKIKSVTRVFEKIASDPRFRYFGNVTIGRDLSVDELRAHYDAVLFACGAETDRRLGIPGEDLPGSHTATAFVGWYNGHPDYRDLTFDLSGEVAVVVGQGNVAMDVTRILATPVDRLRETDIAAHALDALAESRVREIHLIGRRGPVQAKFTTAELKEIGEIEKCEPVVNPVDLELDPASRAELEDPANKLAHKNFEVLRAFSERTLSGRGRQVYIRFLHSPVALEGDVRVTGAVFEANTLEGEPFGLSARGMGTFQTIDCGVFFRSVGYRGVPLPGVPFDDRRAVIPNEHGRVLDNGAPVHGLYATGWIKRGPSGIIGTNKPDSVETVQSILGDMAGLESRPLPDYDAIGELLRSRGVRFVSFDDWHRIDAAEVARGQAAGKPREKFTRVEEMLAVLESPATV